MKAIVIGATGLVGNLIVKKLLERSDVRDVVIFVRRNSGLIHPKLTEHIVDFSHISTWAQNIQGDILFSALGTTIKGAGSKKVQYLIDHDYQLNVADEAAKNNVSSYVLISSVNSNPKSMIFYLRMKGELEEKISRLNFNSVHILRPGPLKGEREKPRLNEIISTRFLDMLPKGFVSFGIQPVEAARVAEVAIQKGMLFRKGVHVIEAEEIHV